MDYSLVLSIWSSSMIHNKMKYGRKRKSEAKILIKE